MRRRDKTTYAMSLHDRLAKEGVFVKSFTVCDFRSRFQTNFIFWMFRIILVYHPSMVKVVRFGDQHRVYQRRNYMKISSSRNFFIFMTIQVIFNYFSGWPYIDPERWRLRLFSMTIKTVFLITAEFLFGSNEKFSIWLTELHPRNIKLVRFNKE